MSEEATCQAGRAWCTMARGIDLEDRSNMCFSFKIAMRQFLVGPCSLVFSPLKRREWKCSFSIWALLLAGPQIVNIHFLSWALALIGPLNSAFLSCELYRIVPHKLVQALEAGEKIIGRSDPWHAFPRSGCCPPSTSIRLRRPLLRRPPGTRRPGSSIRGEGRGAVIWALSI